MLHGRFLRAVFNGLCSFSFIAVNNSIVGNIPERHLIARDLNYHAKPFYPSNLVPSSSPSRGFMARLILDSLNPTYTPVFLTHRVGFVKLRSLLFKWRAYRKQKFHLTQKKWIYAWKKCWKHFLEYMYICLFMGQKKRKIFHVLELFKILACGVQNCM